ncbi:unnamed protein product [Closterium sp. NIES-54]
MGGTTCKAGESQARLPFGRGEENRSSSSGQQRAFMLASNTGVEWGAQRGRHGGNQSRIDGRCNECNASPRIMETVACSALMMG